MYRRQIVNANVPMQYNMYILLTKWEYINICFHFVIENIHHVRMDYSILCLTGF